jgi:hypothetical protein
VFLKRFCFFRRNLLMIRPHHRPFAALLVWAVILCGLSSSAWAQGAEDTSRAGEEARLQAEKAKALRPLVGNRAEQFVLKLERSGLISFAGPQGLYPWFGSVLGGGGVGVGGGYKFSFGDSGSLNFLAGWSFQNYKLLQSNLILPTVAGGRIKSSVDVKWIDAPKVSYYGLGNDSNKEAKTSYLYRPARIGATVGVNITKWFTIGGGGDYLDVQTGPGKLDTSIEEIFTPVTAPGLGQRVTYGVARAFAAIDWRTSPLYTRRGGLYRIDWANHSPSGGSSYGFQQTDVELVQYIPLLRENWVLAFRGAASMISTSGAAQVPYFMMPYLGSGETLRAFQNRRFRDQNSLLLQAEYRWTPSHFIDMVLFTDAGKVAAKRSDLNFDDLHVDYGIGIRFHGPKFTVLRIDLAKGNEGFGLIFSTSIF